MTQGLQVIVRVSTNPNNIQSRKRSGRRLTDQAKDDDPSAREYDGPNRDLETRVDDRERSGETAEAPIPSEGKDHPRPSRHQTLRAKALGDDVEHGQAGCSSSGRSGLVVDLDERAGRRTEDHVEILENEQENDEEDPSRAGPHEHSGNHDLGSEDGWLRHLLDHVCDGIEGGETERRLEQTKDEGPPVWPAG